jgi:hypothetical protein
VDLEKDQLGTRGILKISLEIRLTYQSRAKKWSAKESFQFLGIFVVNTCTELFVPLFFLL